MTVQDADANIGTTKITPYRITDLLTLNDYPHFDSTHVSHKIQFMFTRFLIDHIFLLCDAKERMDSEGTMEIFDIIKDGCGDHFTILLNKIDDSLKDCSSHKDFGKDVLSELKREVLVGSKDGRRGIGTEYGSYVIFTYLVKIDNKVNLDELDRMKKLNELENNDRVKKLKWLEVSNIKNRLNTIDNLNDIEMKEFIGEEIFNTLNESKQKNQNYSTDMLKIIFILKIMKELNLIEADNIVELHQILSELDKHYVMHSSPAKFERNNIVKHLKENLKAINRLKIIGRLEILESAINEALTLPESDLDKYVKHDYFTLSISIINDFLKQKFVMQTKSDIRRLESINSVYTYHEVREKFFKIILNKIPKNEELKKNPEIIIREMNKSNSKLIWIKDENTISKYLIKFDQDDAVNENEYETINSFSEIKRNFKKRHFNPVIRPNLENELIISSIEDFKKSNYHTYSVFDEVDSNYKKIKIVTEQGKFRTSIIITSDKQPCESSDDEYVIINSLEYLEKTFFDIKNPKFAPKSNRNMVISILEDFFKTDETTFVVFSDT